MLRVGVGVGVGVGVQDGGHGDSAGDGLRVAHELLVAVGECGDSVLEAAT